MDPGSYSYVFDDFTGYIVNTTRLLNMGFLTQYSGGSANRVNGKQDHPGILRLQGNAASATGRASIYMGGASSILFGGATKYVFEGMIDVQAVPDATNDFRFTFSMGTDIGSGSTNLNGVAILMNRSINATNYVCQTADGATFTNVDSGVAMATGWKKFKIEVNKTGTSVEFFIDDVSVAVVTTNIPTTTGREVTGLVKVHKIAGATDIIADLDWWHFVADKR